MLYKNIAKKLRFRINSDEFVVGDVLPTERQLMEEYQASRVSIRKAIDELVTLDLIEKKQGSGTYIKQKEVVHLMDQLRSGLESSQKIGQTITSDVLAFGKENELGVFVNNIINGDLAKELFKKVKELHPVRRVEIIKTKVELPKSSA